MAVRKPTGFAKTGRKPKSQDIATERTRFFRALEKYKGARAKAAKELGYNKYAFSRRAKELGLSPRAMAKEFKKYRQEPEKTTEQKILKNEIPQHEQAVRFLASGFGKDVRNLREIIRHSGQSGLTPKWAVKQLRHLQELCRIYSKYHGVSLDWRNYPQLIAMRPYDMSAAVRKEADAIASGAKPLQKKPIQPPADVRILRTRYAAPGAKPLQKEQIQPAAKTSEIDVLRERSRILGALLKHKGTVKRALDELGYSEPEFSSRAAQHGINPKIMKGAFTAYNVRKALIGQGGNVRAAAVAYGTTTAYFGSLMKRFGIDAESYRRAGAEAEKPQGPDVLRKREPWEPRKIKEAAPLRVTNPTIAMVAEGLKKGTYDDQHPPNDEALKIIERACNFDAKLIQTSVGVTYSMWHNWLVRRRLVGWVDRETRLARAQRDAENEREKRQRAEKLGRTKL